MSETYETTDMRLTAYLRCKGLAVVELKQDKGKITFVLAVGSCNIRQYVMDYFNGAEISAIAFMNKLNETKTLMRQI
jgi:hypothetical protein